MEIEPMQSPYDLRGDKMKELAMKTYKVKSSS